MEHIQCVQPQTGHRGEVGSICLNILFYEDAFERPMMLSATRVTDVICFSKAFFNAKKLKNLYVNFILQIFIFLKSAQNCEFNEFWFVKIGANLAFFFVKTGENFLSSQKEKKVKFSPIFTNQNSLNSQFCADFKNIKSLQNKVHISIFQFLCIEESCRNTWHLFLSWR